eukprot:3098272-Amphidinium_carterae.1
MAPALARGTHTSPSQALGCQCTEPPLPKSCHDSLRARLRVSGANSLDDFCTLDLLSRCSRTDSTQYIMDSMPDSIKEALARPW